MSPILSVICLAQFVLLFLSFDYLKPHPQHFKAIIFVYFNLRLCKNEYKVEEKNKNGMVYGINIFLKRKTCVMHNNDFVFVQDK